ncbi:MAG: acyl-CoA dehydratase activase [Atopobiaceae bacterium]|jgi:predicted CoA-substrate-specific enzyme activase
MRSIGIDIGSTATKVAVINDGALELTLLAPTGFSSIQAAESAKKSLATHDIDVESEQVVATGYGRIAVPYATKAVTEITCHAKGAWWLFGRDGVVIDVGGQDTKVLELKAGMLKKFLMNDKCSAGTGKFLEIMANRMNVTQDKLSELAASGEKITISSMCTVFAESEIISLIGRGEPLENIASGVIESVVGKVVALAAQIPGDECFLTGGFCDNAYIVERLAKKLGKPVSTRPEARYAGAIGAALTVQPKATQKPQDS